MSQVTREQMELLVPPVIKDPPDPLELVILDPLGLWDLQDLLGGQENLVMMEYQEERSVWRMEGMQLFITYYAYLKLFGEKAVNFNRFNRSYCNILQLNLPSTFLSKALGCFTSDSDNRYTHLLNLVLHHFSIKYNHCNVHSSWP